MPTPATLKTQKKNKSRLEILKSWMSSFVVTVGVVVAVVVFVPRSPKAEIISAQAFEHEIIYQVQVTDADHALDLSTLKIVLTHQFGTYEVPLSLGMNVGLFENLSPDTDYVMKVYGSKGFGLENLDSLSIKTLGLPGGAIVGYEIIYETEYDYDYLIDVLVSDRESFYASIVLEYGYAYEPDEEIIYQSIDVLESRSSILIEGISAYNVRVHLVLKGLTQLGESVILDEVTYYVPFRLESSIYLDRVSMQEVVYMLYPDSYISFDVTYTFILYQGIQKIQTVDILPSNSLSHYGSQEVILSKLKSDTPYRIEVMATYINPYTLRSESAVIYESAVTTLPTFNAELTITEFDTYYEVEIFVIDPNHLFQIPYYVLYEATGDQPMYIFGEDLGFTPELIGKRAIFIIEKPTESPYQLIIGIRNTNDYTKRHIVFDEVKSE